MQVRVQVTSVREGELRYRYWASIHSWAIGSGWVPAYRSTEVLSERRTACLGVWGRGEGRGVRVKREKKRTGEAGASESGGVKPMNRRGQGLD